MFPEQFEIVRIIKIIAKEMNNSDQMSCVNRK